VVGEGGVGQLNLAFELLKLGAVSHAMATDDMRDADTGKNGAVDGPIWHHNWRHSPVELANFRQESPSCEIISRPGKQVIKEMASLGIDSCKQHEAFAALFDGGFIYHQDRWQVGDRPPTSCPESLAELLDPVPHRDV
jgi:hypothetical protein